MNIFRTVVSMIREYPILVVFDVTRLCNERCRMCNIWRTESDDMSVDEIRNMAIKLSRKGVSYVHLQGGDPSMRPDILEIIDVFNSVKIKPTFITNGILLKGELAEGLAKRRCNVSVSLDTLNPDTFKFIRGVDKFDTVLENIKNAPKKRNGNWSIGCTITGMSTLEEIKSMEKFCDEYNFMFGIRPYVHTIGNAGREEDGLVYHDRETVIQIFKYMRDRSRKTNYIASLLYDECIRYVKGESFPPCDALRRSMAMSSTGLFSPCIEFSNESTELKTLFDKKRDYLSKCKQCNSDHPCFYNCVREIGIIWRKKWKILPHFPQIVFQMIKYGNFF